MAEAGAGSVLSGMGFGVGMGTAYVTIVDLLRTATAWVKWRALGKSVGYPLIAHALHTIESAEKDEISGLTPRGIVDVIYQFMNHTMDMAVLINESVASQMFVQMIQQSIAYAIHASHAGAIGTITNVYSGGTYLSPTETIQVGTEIDLLDRGERGFLSAEAGQNIPTLAFSLGRGVNARIGNVYGSMITHVDSFIDEWNDLALSYYREYRTMCRVRFGDAIGMKETLTTRAYGLLEQIANEHLARISEQLDTLEGAKAWFDAELMQDSELKDIAVKVDLERGASETNFDEHKEAILNAIDNGIGDWDNKIDQALSDIKDSEAQFNTLILSMFNTVFTDVNDFVTIICDMADKAIQDVCAYRNVKQAMSIDVVSEIGVPESSPETELYRLRTTRVYSIDAITIMYEYQRPKGLGLKDADPVITEEVVNIMSVTRIEEIDYDIIRYPCDVLSDMKIKDAGNC